eukprot:PLAT4226.1.p1 GENE.PLAT4226.1~~PLAT4226.1.p1  ORF type:complete len:384 (-),score=108.29 PLAT4226.1:108-1223(-)
MASHPPDGWEEELERLSDQWAPPGLPDDVILSHSERKTYMKRFWRASTADAVINYDFPAPSSPSSSGAAAGRTVPRGGSPVASLLALSEGAADDSAPPSPIASLGGRPLTLESARSLLSARSGGSSPVHAGTDGGKDVKVLTSKDVPEDDRKPSVSRRSARKVEIKLPRRREDMLLPTCHALTPFATAGRRGQFVVSQERSHWKQLTLKPMSPLAKPLKRSKATQDFLSSLGELGISMPSWKRQAFSRSAPLLPALSSSSAASAAGGRAAAHAAAKKSRTAATITVAAPASAGGSHAAGTAASAAMPADAAALQMSSSASASALAMAEGASLPTRTRTAPAKAMRKRTAGKRPPPPPPGRRRIHQRPRTGR